MQNQNHKLSSFWFGLLLGGILVGSGAFFLGTKQGRKMLKNILELSENAEETIALFLEEFGDDIKEKGIEIVGELKKNTKASNHPVESHTLNSLIDKIKTLSPDTQKKVRRFFVKEGKIIEDQKQK